MVEGPVEGLDEQGPRLRLLQRVAARIAGAFKRRTPSSSVIWAR